MQWWDFRVAQFSDKPRHIIYIMHTPPILQCYHWCSVSGYAIFRCSILAQQPGPATGHNHEILENFRCCPRLAGASSKHLFWKLWKSWVKSMGLYWLYFSLDSIWIETSRAAHFFWGNSHSPASLRSIFTSGGPSRNQWVFSTVRHPRGVVPPPFTIHSCQAYSKHHELLET